MGRDWGNRCSTLVLWDEDYGKALMWAIRPYSAICMNGIRCCVVHVYFMHGLYAQHFLVVKYRLECTEISDATVRSDIIFTWGKFINE